MLSHHLQSHQLRLEEVSALLSLLGIPSPLATEYFKVSLDMSILQWHALFFWHLSPAKFGLVHTYLFE
jgi:hypothetical protein